MKISRFERQFLPSLFLSLLASLPAAAMPPAPPPPNPEPEPAPITFIIAQSLNFLPAPQGANPQLIDPSSFEAAVLEVRGEPHAHINISLPHSFELSHSHERNGVDSEIGVKDVLSNDIIQLDAQGFAELRIGATRHALSYTQIPGSYEGAFEVCASYRNLQEQYCEYSATKAEVYSSIDIASVSWLELGIANQGDPSLVVPPIERPSAAEFTVSGEPGSLVEIQIPTSEGVLFTGSGSFIDEQISFLGLHTDSTEIELDGTGTGTFYVGATRDSISASQVPGNYAGSFEVCVSYKDADSEACVASTAVATVVAGLALTHVMNLQFPPVCRGSSRLVTPFDPEAARFAISGEAMMMYSLELPFQANMFHSETPEVRLTLNDFSSDSQQMLDGAGYDEFGVGAGISVPSNQALGFYTGYFTVQALYMLQQHHKSRNAQFVNSADGLATIEVIDCSR